MAPPKPSVQTRLVLEAMEGDRRREEARREEEQRKEDERWNHINENLDLLFARVGNISRMQEQMNVTQDLGAKIMDQVLKDQAKLAHQIENTGKAVAQLSVGRPVWEEEQLNFGEQTTNLFHSRPHHHLSSTSQYGEPFSHDCGGGHKHKFGENNSGYRNAVPMSFPEFSGKDPKVWRHKCEDLFHIYNVPEYLWVTTATLHMKDNAGRWVEVQRLKGELTTWEKFMCAVETKFGAYDYVHALTELMELKQSTSVDDYIAEFESLQFLIEMHNTGYDKMFLLLSLQEA
jgi:hypothetical protein